MQVVIYAYWSYFYFLEVVSVSTQLVVVLNLGEVVGYTDVFKQLVVVLNLGGVVGYTDVFKLWQ